ncbi:hypothetical protein FRACYDRAFT_250654 [Fragilariopsis cylindrus CCMP1102]|uniref:Uncharacterized protein n=1 Tax=Fragilariopsis cylindrus CCMP1102 TaxID=635003 RepID=A0A1E7EPB9_9STRA|nr:hypothetical protein FRACYDRAFT_250654 [Fragilariopsis cylindrus CCMP1102]|eukprot:OEU07636.1 hypothetical protein FRACYDRAFT_250654 [Fragilariopsis cylindrus CCMP1102]
MTKLHSNFSSLYSVWRSLICLCMEIFNLSDVSSTVILDNAIIFIVIGILREDPLSPVLNLCGNPIKEKLGEDPIEKAALLSLLESYITVYCLGDKYLYRLDPDIEFALRIKHARRSIVESGGSNRTKGVQKIRSYLPIIYPWSNERERKNATGLYYLVREVEPTLISRRTASSGMNNGDDDNDDSDDGDDSGDKMMMQERSHRNVKL